MTQTQKPTFSSGPSMLAQIPRAVRKQLDLSMILSEALQTSGHSTPYGPFIALSVIDNYLDAARMQQRRMRPKKQDVFAKGRLSRLFADVHFYLICWDKIDKNSRFIGQATRFRNVKLALRPFKDALKRYRDARDHLSELGVPGSRQDDIASKHSAPTDKTVWFDLSV